MINEELAEALRRLPSWSYAEDRRALYRRLVLADFSEAIALMVRIAIEADKADHHPEWTNVYNRIDIWLTTHEAGGVTSRDTALAEMIDTLGARSETSVVAPDGRS